MARVDKEASARIAGMDYALRRIKEIGIDAFEKELQWRGGKNFSYTVTPQHISKAVGELYKHVRIGVLVCLIDEFDFGKEELHRFNDRYNDKMDSIKKDYAVWGDYESILLEELGNNEKIEYVEDD